jgi:hypothetical protein
MSQITIPYLNMQQLMSPAVGVLLQRFFKTAPSLEVELVVADHSPEAAAFEYAKHVRSVQ